MQVMAVTYYDEDGTQHVGELVNASTIIHKGKRTIETQIDRQRPDEVIVFTWDVHDEWGVQAVKLADVRYIRPLRVS